ncbi:107-domain-containing protein [Aspergillus karnatakaensis]|uniref:nucleoporin Nup84/Nup107 family protein n=1 Tax=Aspergillus karnatakaensis TaxID=1810916 RepID=UPI003CCD242C
MAPLTRPPGSAGPNSGFPSFNQNHRPTNETAIIEIDDDDDEPMVDDEEEADEEGEDDEVLEVEDDEDMDNGEEDEAEEDASIDDMNGNESPLDLIGAPNGQSRSFRANPGHNFDRATDGFDAAASEFFTSAGAQEALHPLRRTADRVTRQIEAFAEKLDRFKQKGNRTDQLGSYQAVYQLVKGYHTIAEDAIQDLSKQNTLKRAKMGWSFNKTNGTPASDLKTDEELQRLQLEANTWKLLHNLIGINDPSTRDTYRQTQENVFQKLHRYSSDREVWDQFVRADPYAVECVVIMKWLEYTAQTSPHQEIDSLISELEKQAERGQGSWAHGWLETKETIKAQKRLRAWPRPLEPNDPSIAASLLTSEQSEPLVTQLDPDAVTRQQQNLQRKDQFYERATWMTCWKMLRRGENWTKIRDWAASRLENWRAVSICGSSVDAGLGEEHTPIDDGTTRMMNWRSQETWRAACSSLSRDTKTEDFQRAVYALLCGESEAAFKVCQSWDDYLYVYFNNVVLSRYRHFCKQLQRKLNHSPTSPAVYTPEPVGYADFNKFVQYTKGNERVGSEARNPYRTIQAVILGRGYDSFFTSLSRAVSQVAHSQERTFVPKLSSTPVDDSIRFTAEDPDALRIATHLYIIANSMGLVRNDTKFFEHASVSVMGYIAHLEQVGVADWIPLYASLLPTVQTQFVLGQVLINIVDSRERRLQVQLMKKYDINFEAVHQRQWQSAINAQDAIERPRTLTRYPKVVTRKDGYRELVPVKKDFIGTDLSSEEERIIRSLEWLRYYDGQWPLICEYGAECYRRFFLQGRLPAARELSRRMRTAEISLEYFGFDVAEYAVDYQDGATENGTPEPSSPTKTRLYGHKRNKSSNSQPTDNIKLLVTQSETMRDLEQLILAFDALERFALVCEKLDQSKRRRDSGTIKGLIEELQYSLDTVSIHVDELLYDFLDHPHNEEEQADFEEIRTLYIPELFLEYHSALYYSAHVISSDILVQCMNLAMQVAENEFLTRAFVAAERMAELMDALALSSKAMINAKAKPGVRLLGGESLSIWNVAVEEEEERDEAGQEVAAK